MAEKKNPRVAVWKFASCDGCQLSLLDCEDELLQVAEHIDIVYFLEATSFRAPGPYDISLVEGSITTAEDAERIEEIRRNSKFVVAIGACATSGGIQALRNFSDVRDFASIVYANPKYIRTLRTSTPISDHVKVDFELQGCPINKYQLLELINALLNGRKPNIKPHSVCLECKLKGNPCIMVAHGTACLGPVTNGGCQALCPSYHRGCFGCFGPQETKNISSLADRFQQMGVQQKDIVRALRMFCSNSPAFREESQNREHAASS